MTSIDIYLVLKPRGRAVNDAAGKFECCPPSDWMILSTLEDNLETLSISEDKDLTYFRRYIILEFNVNILQCSEDLGFFVQVLMCCHS